MNGLGLLVAIAALGVDVGWETGPGGRLLYTIRIEQVLLQPLRDGQAVVSTVDPSDRGLRRFQVVVGPKPAGTAGDSATIHDTTRLETMVQYGWRTGEDGGVDYLVQMTPERLQSLSNGVPLMCEVDSQVTEMRRIYVYAGVGQVPRTTLPPPTTRQPDPPTFVPGSDPALPQTPPLPRPRIEAPRSDAANPYPPLTNSNANSGYSPLPDNRSGIWQSDPANNQYSPGGMRSNEPAGWSAGLNDPRNAQYGNDPRNSAAWSQPADSRLFPVGYDPRANSAHNDAPVAPDRNYAQRPASDPPATPPAAPAAPAPAAPTWQTAPPNGWATNSSLAKAADEAVRPWTPLILTTLALFASLGANAYLAWLAWSFFWRYRDAITDLARSRSSSALSRQAA
jgi:hypothetical protein